MGPPEYVRSVGPVQGPGGRRFRRCLLKGCEQPFQPSHPLCRYCGKPCQDAARDWQRWRSARHYRSTPRGQERRREQSRRYRERQRLRRATEAAELTTLAATVEEREGQLKAGILEDSSGAGCERPGCYALFVPQPHDPPQRFCCAACRRALRRVEEREARWYRRRERHVAGGGRPPPCAGSMSAHIASGRADD